MDQTYCSKCGKKVYKNLNFCPYCGKKQTSSFSKEEIEKNPYQVLQVSVDAEPEVVKAAYKSLSKKYHPDIDSSPSAQEKMKDINWAYSVLSNPNKRKEWDDNQKKGESHKKTPQAQKSTTTTRTDPRVKHQERYYNKKPRSQQKTAQPPSEKNKKSLTPRRGALLAISLMIVVPLCLYFLFNTQNAPSAYSDSSSEKGATRAPVIPTKVPTHAPARVPTEVPYDFYEYADKVIDMVNKWQLHTENAMNSDLDSRTIRELGLAQAALDEAVRIPFPDKCSRCRTVDRILSYLAAANRNMDKAIAKGDIYGIEFAADAFDRNLEQLENALR